MIDVIPLGTGGQSLQKLTISFEVIHVGVQGDSVGLLKTESNGGEMLSTVGITVGIDT